jgi:hypothetical protein
LVSLEQDDFVRNNRGINDGENVPENFLKRLYNNIKYNEIQLKADHLGTSGSNGRRNDIDYDGLLRRQRDVADATFTPASVGRQAQLRVRAGMHERDMFELIAVRAYDAIETVFNTTQSTVLRRRALEGFQHYATVSAYYGMVEQFDRLLILLCRQFVTLARDQGRLYRQARVAEIQEEERQERVAAEERERQAELDMASFEEEEDGSMSGSSSQAVPIDRAGLERGDILETGAGEATIGRAGAITLTGRQPSMSEIDMGGNSRDHLDDDVLSTSKTMLLLGCIARLTREHGHVMKSGWRKVAECILVLYELDALPKNLSRMGWSLRSQREHKVGGRRTGEEDRSDDDEDGERDEDEGLDDDGGGGEFLNSCFWYIKKG